MTSKKRLFIAALAVVGLIGAVAGFVATAPSNEEFKTAKGDRIDLKLGGGVTVVEKNVVAERPTKSDRVDPR